MHAVIEVERVGKENGGLFMTTTKQEDGLVIGQDVYFSLADAQHDLLSVDPNGIIVRITQDMLQELIEESSLKAFFK